MPRISFTPLMVGLFLVSAIVSVVLAHVLSAGVCLGVVAVCMVLPQYSLVLLRPAFIRRRPETEQVILRLNLYSLMLGFLALLTVVSIRTLGPDIRSAAVLIILAALVWVGRDVLQVVREHQRLDNFSQVRF